MKCLLYSTDLMFVSQASQPIRDAGYELKAVGGTAALLAEPLDDVGMVVVDLTMPAFDAQEVATQLKSQSARELRLIAVGPHVHHVKLDAARQAGWRVFTRGQFSAATSTSL